MTVNRRPLRETIALAALALVLAGVYGPVAVELFKDWGRDPNYSHGYLIPVVSAILVWRRRKELASMKASPSAWGFLGLLLAGAALVFGAAGAEVFTQRMSLLLALGSLVLLLWGWRILGRTTFPLAFLFLAIPMPYVIYYGVTGPLQGLAARCAVAGIQGVGILAVGEGNIIHLPGTSLEVAEACSGIRSLYAFLALGALFARSLPVPSWGRWLVFLLTIPLSVLGNAIRVWGTGVGAHLFGPEVARGMIHESFGLIIFAISLVLLLLLGKGARALWSDASSSPS